MQKYQERKRSGRNAKTGVKTDTMEYVLECLRNNTTKVRNIRSYMLTTLYNAPVTCSNYYKAEVNYDFYGK